jgi:hypothetical protein
MGLRWQDLPPQVLAALRGGTVIPAHPLALDSDRKLDPRRQRALTRYYLDAGAGGLAVGVHTTQFAIREAGLFAPVLELAMRSATDWARARPIMIAGLAGRTAQAVQEAQIARDLGYHAGLLSLAALKGAHEDELIAHAQAVAREIPLVGFYLQPAVGGLVLPVPFWRRFAEIENVVAIKIAPFNRYRTLDVVRGWVEAGGPPVQPPTRTGFGTRLISRGLAGNFGGEVSLDYRMSGVVCTLEASLKGLQAIDTPPDFH